MRVSGARAGKGDSKAQAFAQTIFSSGWREIRPCWHGSWQQGPTIFLCWFGREWI